MIMKIMMLIKLAFIYYALKYGRQFIKNICPLKLLNPHRNGKI